MVRKFLRQQVYVRFSEMAMLVVMVVVVIMLGCGYRWGGWWNE